MAVILVVPATFLNVTVATWYVVKSGLDMVLVATVATVVLELE